jgi:hypothetical protein
MKNHQTSSTLIYVVAARRYNFKVDIVTLNKPFLLKHLGIQSHFYFQVVKVVEVEVVMMKAVTVESTVMTMMIWILDLHLAVPHLVVLVEIGLFVCLNPGFISEYFWNFIHGYMTRSLEYSSPQK